MLLFQEDPTAIPTGAFGAARGLGFRFALVLACVAVSLFALGWKRLQTLTEQQFDRAAVWATAISRFGLFGFLFFVLRLKPRGDVIFYWAEAQGVLKGGLPYRDFYTVYAPLHPYLDGLFLRIYNQPISLMWLPLLAECALVFLWLRAGRMLFSDAGLRRATILYVTCGMGIQFVGVDGQNTIVAALFVVGAVYLLVRNRALLSGVCLGAGIALIKFLPLLFTPLYFFGAGKGRWRWALGIILACVPVYATFQLIGAPILRAVTDAGALRTAGDVPFLVESLTGHMISDRAANLIVLIPLMAVLLFGMAMLRGRSHEDRMRIIVFGMGAVTVTLVLLAKKSWSPYLMLALFPICLAVPLGRARALVFEAFVVVAVMEASIWNWWLSGRTSLQVHTYVVHGDVHALFLLVDVAELAGYVWLLVSSLERMRRPGLDGRPAIEELPATETPR